MPFRLPRLQSQYRRVGFSTQWAQFRRFFGADETPATGHNIDKKLPIFGGSAQGGNNIWSLLWPVIVVPV